MVYSVSDTQDKAKDDRCLYPRCEDGCKGHSNVNIPRMPRFVTTCQPADCGQFIEDVRRPFKFPRYTIKVV